MGIYDILKFYADKENYKQTREHGQWKDSAVESDNGELARQALSWLEPDHARIVAENTSPVSMQEKVDEQNLNDELTQDEQDFKDAMEDCIKHEEQVNKEIELSDMEFDREMKRVDRYLSKMKEDLDRNYNKSKDLDDWYNSTPRSGLT